MTSNEITQNVSQVILRTVENLRHGTGFGSVEIIVHEGRVTQIEKRERQRFVQSKEGLLKEKALTALNVINSDAI